MFKNFGWMFAMAAILDSIDGETSMNKVKSCVKEKGEPKNVKRDDNTIGKGDTVIGKIVRKVRISEDKLKDIVCDKNYSKKFTISEDDLKDLVCNYDYIENALRLLTEDAEFENGSLREKVTEVLKKIDKERKASMDKCEEAEPFKDFDSDELREVKDHIEEYKRSTKSILQNRLEHAKEQFEKEHPKVKKEVEEEVATKYPIKKETKYVFNLEKARKQPKSLQENLEDLYIKLGLLKKEVETDIKKENLIPEDIISLVIGVGVLYARFMQIYSTMKDVVEEYEEEK